ncbi:MAG: metallophosphoesterase [Duodenibacillus sp.]|nr:metallophosphoesterase [Duodenibacillus sp.]
MLMIVFTFAAAGAAWTCVLRRLCPAAGPARRLAPALLAAAALWPQWIWAACDRLPAWALLACCWLGMGLTLAGLAVGLRAAAAWFARGRRGGLPGVDGLEALVILAACLFLSAWAVGEGTQEPAVRRVEIAVPGLPPAFDGLRVAQLSDIHASAVFGRGRVERVVERTNGAHPDLIVITGDVADGKLADRLKDVEPLERLEAPLGVYGVDGNHEHYADARAWAAHWDASRITWLRNAWVAFERNRQTLVLAGKADLRAAEYPWREQPSIEKALRGAPAGECVIVLDHQPRNAGLNAAAGARLQLSGHTHGGQAPVVDLFAWLKNGFFLRGAYELEGGSKLYVHSGTHLFAAFPFRVFTEPEIALITLRREASR